jgi:2,5-diamino-6-(ribosylamino)-4(3H)-pyrimidinone 5'-phosphate reductase
MLPRVILHNAVSADGRIDWITPDLGQFYQLASRFEEEATLAGSDTILSAQDDIPEEDETVFQPPGKTAGDPRPLLVVPDSRGRVRTWHYWRQLPYWRGCVALCSSSTPGDYLDYLTQRHIQYIVAGKNRVDLREALEQLNARYGVKTVRVDSGGILNGVLLRAGLVDEVSLLISPALVGGISPRSMFRAPDLTSPQGVIQLRFIDVQVLEGDTVWLRYEILKDGQRLFDPIHQSLESWLPGETVTQMSKEEG